MPDYTKAMGSQQGSYMLIRDTGSYVEFWIKSGSPYTWAENFPWGYTINGSTTWTTADYPTGGKLRRLGRWDIVYSQDVTFRLGSTGTVGLNGPTTFTRFIQRGAVRVRTSSGYQLAEAWVRSKGVWKRAEPYVRDGGKWKLCG